MVREEEGDLNVEESRSPRHQLRVQQGCCLPFISRIYSRRFYMGRCSLPISPRRPFVPRPLCASNKTQRPRKQTFSRSRCDRHGLCARIIRDYAPNAPRARIPGVGLSLARSTLRARIADPANATNGKRPGRDRGPAIKSPTNDKQISHSGSPIYRCCNTWPHTQLIHRDILARVAEDIIESMPAMNDARRPLRFVRDREDPWGLIKFDYSLRLSRSEIKSDLGNDVRRSKEFACLGGSSVLSNVYIRILFCYIGSVSQKYNI